MQFETEQSEQKIWKSTHANIHILQIKVTGLFMRLAVLPKTAGGGVESYKLH